MYHYQQGRATLAEFNLPDGDIRDGSRADAGVEIDLALVPQRETGMMPYEMTISESQEPTA